MLDPVAAVKFGFFGKIPSVGDFVSRGVPTSQAGLLDDWFSAGLAFLQAELENWLDHYLVAPVWSFYIPAGIWGERSVCGALMPSVDRVGRYYPLIALAAVPGELSGHEANLHSRLTVLAERLPELLQHSYMPDEVERFINEPCTTVLSFEQDEGFATLNTIYASTLSSYWWANSKESSLGVEFSVHPNKYLFKKIFTQA